MTDRVGLVLVSHSARLAEGVAELAGQMAPDVRIVAAGGGDDGGLGTSFDRISQALDAVASPAGVVVLYDLGSALLTTETALEFLDPDVAATIEVVDAPLVEGALAAATTAQGGASRADVAAAARAAGATSSADRTAPAVPSTAVTQTLTLRNALGLHARPAADLIGALSGLSAQVWLGRADADRVDARSLLAVVRLALRGGEQLAVSATGPDAQAALDRVATLVDRGFGELDGPPAAEPTTAGPAPGAIGLAVGPLVRPVPADVADRPADDKKAERTLLDTALSAVANRLARGDALQRAHGALLLDPQLAAAAHEIIATGSAAAPAWWRAARDAAEAMAASSDELVAARAVDVRDAGAAVLAELGEPVDRIPPTLDGAILVADELGPSEVSAVASRGGAGIVLAAGSPTAHAVVVARGLGLPLVLRAGSLLDAVPVGTLLAIDGDAGTVDIDPDDLDARRATVAEARAAREAQRRASAEPVFVDGRQVLVAANVGSLADAQAAVDGGADGVGLLRTELLVLDHARLPDEDEQVADLTAVLGVLGDRPVVVRVLDAGGDKPVRALALDPQHNGFLGVRGLRWLLANPAVLHTQLRAISRAAAGHNVSVMAPMVTIASEARQFQAAVAAAVASLDADRIAHGHLAGIGAMIEVPAAALAADEIGREVDFVSVGSNDLVAYTMAAERTESGVADLLDPAATAIWRLIEQLCRSAGVDVAVCGEMAADPRFVRRFVDLGVSELSVAPARVPAVKALLRGD